MVADSQPISMPSEGERWISFLRGYGPVNRIDGMYAETIAGHARKHGVPPLDFEHPTMAMLSELLRPREGRMTNIILTGTAGDGKTTLCNRLWTAFGGDDGRVTGRNRANYLHLDVETPLGVRRVHFIFEFSGWSPPAGEPWSAAALDLLDRFALSVGQTDPFEFFVIAANDGRLVQAWDTLPEKNRARELAPVIEELLATERKQLSGVSLQFLNLSRIPTRDLLERALDCILARPEWRCFEREADDPAFGEGSSLLLNFRLLGTPAVRSRLLALAELLDANGLHVPIREILLFLVNCLLGCAGAPEHVCTAAFLRELAERGARHESALFDCVFGGNLPDRARDRLAVFRHLGALRIGHETTNLLDALVVYGADDPGLQADWAAYVAVSDPYYAGAGFENMRRAYLDAEEERSDTSGPFTKALVAERRRLFFRLPDAPGRLDPWRLGVFKSAGAYLRQLVAPLREGARLDPTVVRQLVCGLNRIWTGLLVEDLDRLFLSTGLDLSSAKVSEVFLYEVPLRRSPHGDEVSITLVDHVPTLRVSLGRAGHGASFRLHLTRYEFLVRVAQGALPGTFSHECNEDVVAFKSQVLSEFYAFAAEASAPLSVLVLGPRGTLSSHELGLTL